MTPIAAKACKVFVNNWVFNCIHLLLSIYVVREYGAQGKGLLTLLTATAGFLAALLTLGLDNSVVHYVKRARISLADGLKHFLVHVLIASVMTGFLAAVFRTQLWHVVFPELAYSRTALTIVLVYVPVLMVMLVLKGVVLGMHDTRRYTVLVVGPALCALMGVCALTESGISSVGAIAAWLVASDAIFASYYAYAMLRHDGETVDVNRARARDLYSFGAKGYMGTVGTALFVRIDYLVIAAFMNTEALGYYSIAKFFYQAMLTLPQAINGLLLGTYSAGSGAAAELNARVFRHLFILLGGIVLLGVLMGGWCIPMMYGADFRATLPAFYILLFAGLLMGSTSPSHVYFMGVGRPGLSSKISVAGGAMKVLLTILLVRRYSIEGVALATLASAALIFALRILYVKRVGEVPACGTNY
jgi:O-antigen/teichoic acid export membrane protein